MTSPQEYELKEQQQQQQQQDLLAEPSLTAPETSVREQRRPSLGDITHSLLGMFGRDRARTPPLPPSSSPGTSGPKTPEKYLQKPGKLQVPEDNSPTPKSRRRSRLGFPEAESKEGGPSTKTHRKLLRPEFVRSKSDSPVKEGSDGKDTKDSEGTDKLSSKVSGLRSLSRKFMRSLPEIRITDIDPANIPLPPTPNPKIPSKYKSEGAENTPLGTSFLRHSASFDESPSSNREARVEPNRRRSASFELPSNIKPLDMDKLLPFPPGGVPPRSYVSDEEVDLEDFPTHPTRRPSVSFNLEPQTIPLPPSPQASMISIEHPLVLTATPQQRRKSPSPPPTKGLHTIPEIPSNIKAALVLLEHLSEEDITEKFFPALLEIRLPRLDKSINRFLRFSGLKGIYDNNVEHESSNANFSHLSVMSMRFIGRTLLGDHELGDAAARVLVHETRQIRGNDRDQRASSSGSSSSSSSTRSHGSGYESDMESLATNSSSDDLSRRSLHDSEKDEQLPVRYISNIPSLDAKRSYFQLTKLAIAELKLKYESETMSLSEYMIAYSSLSEMMSNLPIFGSYSPIQIIDIYISIGEVMPASCNLSVYNMGKMRNILQYLDDSCIVVLAELRPDESERDYVAAEEIVARLARERKKYLRDNCYWKAEGYFAETIMVLERLTKDPAGRMLWGREAGEGGDYSDDYDSNDSGDVVYMGSGSDDQEEMEREVNDAAGWESYDGDEGSTEDSSEDGSQPYVDAEEEKGMDREDNEANTTTEGERVTKEVKDDNFQPPTVEDGEHRYLDDDELDETNTAGGVSLSVPGPGETSGVELMKAAIKGEGVDLL